MAAIKIKIEINISSICELREVFDLIEELKRDNPNKTLDVSIRVAG